MLILFSWSLCRLGHATMSSSLSLSSLAPPSRLRLPLRRRRAAATNDSGANNTDPRIKVCASLSQFLYFATTGIQLLLSHTYFATTNTQLKSCNPNPPLISSQFYLITMDPILWISKTLSKSYQSSFSYKIKHKFKMTYTSKLARTSIDPNKSLQFLHG